MIQTIPIDLSLAEALEIVIHFPIERAIIMKNKQQTSINDWSGNNVYLQCSVDGGQFNLF